MTLWQRLLFWAAIPAWVMAAMAAAPIDREALVRRHNPKLTAPEPRSPLSVGNGQFCFTADITGLQTLTELYRKEGLALETQARWAWHANPNPARYTLENAHQPFTAYGKTLGYPTDQGSPAGKWLRENPHAWPLGQLGFVDRDGAALAAADLTDSAQELDLWTGELRSRFAWRGRPVEVATLCDPREDALVVRIVSAALANGDLQVRLAFPRGHDVKTKNYPALDWSEPATHTTEVVRTETWEHRTSVGLRRRRDTATYGVAFDVETGSIVRAGPHALLARGAGERMTLRVIYAAEPPRATGMAWDDVRKAAADHWKDFWRSGAAVDFSGSTDPRAAELERRTVLSQYLTAIQFGGDFPPSETGLTASSWYQKHHTEMVWWHAAHFALWGRDRYLENLLAAYVRALPQARAIAASRGLAGARWPKMVGPDWRESPGGNPLIVWNQPHPIQLAELLYRNAPSLDVLLRYQAIVQATAEGMAAMLHWDEAKRRFNLGPPLWIAQEIHDPATSMNPTYELSYWIRGLKIAQDWRERLALPRVAAWDERIARIAALPTKDGKYTAIESVPDTWDNVASRHDHPSFLMALGQLPGDGVDRATMARTLDAVLASWDWETKIWGWDYPMVAMTAARLGKTKEAVDTLLFTQGPNNAYLKNGHCPQRGDLPVYLPANGALLAAVALMAGGWEGAPEGEAPGFPRDGTWVVRSEGLKRLP